MMRFLRRTLLYGIGWLDGWMDEWMDRQVDEWVWSGRQADGWICRCMYICMDEWLDGWMDYSCLMFL
jgi:hypothetical protein